MPSPFGVPSHDDGSNSAVARLMRISPASAVASVSGLSGTGAGLGGIAFTWITGRVVDQVSYQPIFVAAGLMPLAALALVFRLIPQVRPLELSRG